MPGLDLTVADVVYDSLLDEARGVDEPQRLLRFSLKDSAVVAVTVELRPRGVALTVRVEPTGRYQITLLTQPELSLTYETDDDGVAVLGDLPSGLLSLRVDAKDRSSPQPFRTAWLSY